MSQWDTAASRTRGFTLVEILVALMIFSITMLTLFSSVNTFLSSGSRIREQVGERQKFQPGLDIMISDLEQIFSLEPPRYKKPVPQSRPDRFRLKAAQTRIRGTAFSTLTFASLNHIPPAPAPVTGVAWITYYVAQRNGVLNLFRSDRLVRPDPEDPEHLEPSPCRDPILFRDILAFNLTCVDGENEPYDTWDSDTKPFHYGFPARILIQVRLNHGSAPLDIETAVTLEAGQRGMP